MTAAVDGLDLVEQFLNTLDRRTFARHGEHHVVTDELTSPDALARWLQARGLAAPQEGLRPRDVQAARALRTALRGALADDGDDDGNDDGNSDDGTGGTPDRAAVALPARFALRLVPDPSGRLRLGAASGVPGLDVVVEAVAAAVAAGRLGRLKLCAAADCRWAFHDTSRSGGGRWCSMEVCGNRHKTRAYRRRQSA